MSVSLDPTPTTTQLLRTAMDGDPGAWEEIVRRYEPAVAAMVVTYRLQEVGEPTLADILAEHGLIGDKALV